MASKVETSIETRTKNVALQDHAVVLRQSDIFTDVR